MDKAMQYGIKLSLAVKELAKKENISFDQALKLIGITEQYKILDQLPDLMNTIMGKAGGYGMADERAEEFLPEPVIEITSLLKQCSREELQRISDTVVELIVKADKKTPRTKLRP